MYSFIYCSFIKKGEIGYIVSTPVCKVEQLSTRYRMCNDKNQVYKCAAFYGQVFNFSSIRLRWRQGSRRLFFLVVGQERWGGGGGGVVDQGGPWPKGALQYKEQYNEKNILYIILTVEQEDRFYNNQQPINVFLTRGSKISLGSPVSVCFVLLMLFCFFAKKTALGWNALGDKTTIIICQTAIDLLITLPFCRTSHSRLKTNQDYWQLWSFSLVLALVFLSSQFVFKCPRMLATNLMLRHLELFLWNIRVNWISSWLDTVAI